MRADMIPGAKFPDYRLPDQDGTDRRLSELQGIDPMVLTLARGGYCPKEHLQHVWMAEMEPQFAVAYTRLVTISTDSQLATMEWRRRLGAHWPFLCDPQRKIQKDLEIAEYTDPVHDPMIPYTLVLAPGLVIYKIYNGYWYWGRPTPEELRQDLRELTRRCRPDWDISARELKQRWEKGERDSFYPYEPSS